MVKSFLTKVPIQFTSERKTFSKNDAGTTEYKEEKVTQTPYHTETLKLFANIYKGESYINKSPKRKKLINNSMSNKTILQE